MGTDLWAGARLTAAEIRRNRGLQAMLLAELCILATAVPLAAVTMGPTVNFVMDFGWLSISVLGSLAALVTVIQLMYRDTEQRGIYVLLPHMHGRVRYVLFRFLGLILSLSMAMILMELMLAATVAFLGWDK